MKKVYVGKIVVFVPGKSSRIKLQNGAKECPAIVTQVFPEDRANITVFGPNERCTDTAFSIAPEGSQLDGADYWKDVQSTEEAPAAEQ